MITRLLFFKAPLSSHPNCNLPAASFSEFPCVYRVLSNIITNTHRCTRVNLHPPYIPILYSRAKHRLLGLKFRTVFGDVIRVSRTYVALYMIYTIAIFCCKQLVGIPPGTTCATHIIHLRHTSSVLRAQYGYVHKILL